MASISWQSAVAGLPTVHQQRPVFTVQTLSQSNTRSSNTQSFNSSIQSHRSRVFARRSAQLPSITRTDPLNQRTHQSTEEVVGAGRGAGSRLPSVFLTTDYRDTSTTRHKPHRSKYDGGHGPKLAGGVAGMSSKEAGTHYLKPDRMAMGWAEVRAAQTIPNLRDSQELEHSTGERETKHPTEVNQSLESTRKPDEVPNNTDSANHTHFYKSKKKQTVSNATAQSTGKDNHRKQTGGSYSKLSSGYGSMSSESPRAEEIPKHPIFKPGDSHSEPGLTKASHKKREMEGIYGSVVRVEDDHNKTHSRKDKEYVLSEREAQSYRDLTTTYRDTAERDKQKRKQLFFKKLQDVQIVSALQHNLELSEQASRRQQARRRQQEQLNHIRTKFEEERIKRFKTQYVTKNFLSYEKADRLEYGLPEQHMEKKPPRAPIKRSGGEKITPLAFINKHVKLKKSYSKMFTDPKTGKKMKDPKMEGVDQVTVEVYDSQGATKKNKIDVKTELQQAKKMVQDVDADEDVVDSTLATEPSPPKLHTRAKDNPTKQYGSTTANQTTTADSNQKASHISNSSKSESRKVVTKPPIHSDKRRTTTDNASNKTVKSTNDPLHRSNQNTKKSTHQPQDKSSLLVPSSAGRGKLGVTAHADTVSINSRISVITEESEEDADFYDRLMAKYGIEMSDDDDDVI